MVVALLLIAVVSWTGRMHDPRINGTLSADATPASYLPVADQTGLVMVNQEGQRCR